MGASPWSDHLRRGWSKTSSVNGLEVAVACWSCQTLRLLRISSRMAIRHQEHRQFGAECSGVDDLGLEMETTCTGCALVDIRGGSDDYMLHTVDYDWAVAYQERPGSVLSPSRVRPEFDWSPDDWRDSCMATSTNNGQMTVERRKAETIGELDTHLGYMMAELGRGIAGAERDARTLQHHDGLTCNQRRTRQGSNGASSGDGQAVPEEHLGHSRLDLRRNLSYLRSGLRDRRIGKVPQAIGRFIMFWLALLFGSIIAVGIYWDDLVQGWKALMVEFEGEDE